VDLEALEINKNNSVVIGLCKYEYLNIILNYYPKDIKENFNLYLIVDTDKLDIDKVKSIISEYNINVFNNAILIKRKDILDYYIKLFNLDDDAINFLYNYGPSFKIPLYDYINKFYSLENLLVLDDDIFIFGDLNSLFINETYMYHTFKFDFLDKLKPTKRSYEIINEYNKIFNTDFTLESINTLTLNSGTVLLKSNPNILDNFLKFATNKYIQNLSKELNSQNKRYYFEQRFFHFYIHTLNNKYAFFDKCIMLFNKVKVGSKNFGIRKMPIVFHYAVGKQKNAFLKNMLTALEWKYGKYIPKYELINKI